MDDTCQHYVGERVKLDHFGYFKGKIVPSVSVGCPVVQDGYFKGKIGSLPYFFKVLILILKISFIGIEIVFDTI